jgi:hypothetical protein
MIDDTGRDPEKDFTPGLYRHMKSGGLYTAMRLIRHGANRKPMVVFVSHRYGGESTRALYGWPGDEEAWLDMVKIEIKGVPVEVRRFAHIGALPSDTPIEDRAQVFMQELEALAEASRLTSGP